MQVTYTLRAVNDPRINVILARGCAAGIDRELALKDIRAGARFDDLEKLALVAIKRVGVIIEKDLYGCSLRGGLVQLEKVVK